MPAVYSMRNLGYMDVQSCKSYLSYETICIHFTNVLFSFLPSELFVNNMTQTKTDEI